jgi:hypothetical protein
VGNPPRTEEELDRDIPNLLGERDYAAWKALIEKGNVPAIKEGMRIWGLPIQPLGAFEVDAAIETAERPDALD